MSDFSDIFYLTAAMVVFSLLSVNTAKSFLSTSDTVIRSDIEYQAIALAQDQIDQVKFVSRDKENYFKPSHSSYMFDDYPKTVTEQYGESNEYEQIFTIDASSEFIDESDPLLNRYLVTVTVTNNNLEPAVEVELVFIKSFEK